MFECHSDIITIFSFFGLDRIIVSPFITLLHHSLKWSLTFIDFTAIIFSPLFVLKSVCFFVLLLYSTILSKSTASIQTLQKRLSGDCFESSHPNLYDNFTQLKFFIDTPYWVVYHFFPTQTLRFCCWFSLVCIVFCCFKGVFEI